MNAVVQHTRAHDEAHSAVDSAIDSYMAAGNAEDDEALISAALASANRATPRAGAKTSDSDGDTATSTELKAMRRMLETQLAQLAWNDLTRRAPIHTEILTDLTEVGLSQTLAGQIVAQLPSGTDLIKARRLSIALLSQRLNVTGDHWLDKGGRVALVGPTGVGKTTALAKLAVRWVLRHGARSLALISADGVRIGAHDQMQALGQMLDVPVYIADSFNDIPKFLEQLGQQRLVLVDTPGMSQRDAQLATRMEQLAAAGHGLETALVLSASTQAGAIEETVKRYAKAKPASALLTKVDEAASLGGILSVLADTAMPVSYVSEGQRVPEDLRPARALELVSRAVQLAKATGAAADEDLLRRRYGDVAHAIA
jgi:flagellar biosynthesis protein FlhF